MAEKEKIIKEKLEHAGLFDYGAFYSFAHSWFKEEKYGVTEEKYAEKVSGNKRNIDIEWKATKELSDYYKFEMKIKFLIKDLTDVEVELNGKKEKMNQGKTEVEVTGYLIKDHKSKWDTSAFSRFMRDFYNNHIVPSRINDMENLLTSELKGFKEELKSFLEIMGRR